MELMQFVFSSFWHWAGTLILISVPLAVLEGAIDKRKDK